MSIKNRITLNCIIAAMLSAGAVWAMAYVAHVLALNGFVAAVFFSKYFSSETLYFVLYLYDVFRFGVFGILCAVLMLGLRPRMVGLYSAASFISSFFIFQIPGVLRVGGVFAVSLSITWVLTIPLLYWLLCHIGRNRHNKALKFAPAGPDA